MKITDHLRNLLPALKAAPELIKDAAEVGIFFVLILPVVILFCGFTLTSIIGTPLVLIVDFLTNKYGNPDHSSYDFIWWIVGIPSFLFAANYSWNTWENEIRENIKQFISKHAENKQGFLGTAFIFSAIVVIGMIFFIYEKTTINNYDDCLKEYVKDARTSEAAREMISMCYRKFKRHNK
jgi:hypothetical protein